MRRSLPLADFIEINESCPNVHHGGGKGAATANDELAARTKAVVAVRDAAAKKDGRRVPILVKMGDLGDAKATVRAARCDPNAIQDGELRVGERD